MFGSERENERKFIHHEAGWQLGNFQKARTRHTNKENGSEPDFLIGPNHLQAIKEAHTAEGFVTISTVQLTTVIHHMMCVASALSQVRSADPASGVCQIASCVLLCLNESEVRARKTHARKTRWLGTCVNPRVEYCTVVYASVTKTEQITDDNKCSLLLLFMSKLFICFGDAGPGRWGQRVKGEDKIIIATHSFHSNTFHYHPECVTNSTTPLITKLNLCPSPLRSTDCSVINMWVSGGGTGEGLQMQPRHFCIWSCAWSRADGNEQSRQTNVFRSGSKRSTL